MKSNVNLSLLVPVYNAEKFIIKNLKKLQKTAEKIEKNFEIIIVNDGSNDRYIVKNAPLPVGSSIECVQGKIVIPSGGSIKAKSDNASGTADVIVSLLTDVS